MTATCSIKKAYRKKALELHPDRNYGNVEATTKLFAEVQSAYEVLSDPQERSWYDSHRSTMLRGASGASGEHYEHNVRVTTSDDLMRIFARFTGQIDFSDSRSGFYGVLRDVFDTLAKEERVACEFDGLDPIDYPSFGHADDDYEEVVRPFYANWNGFATKKTFSWMDVYRTVDASDRRVRRMMEKENKRFRDAGIRDFNDTVRQLVAFVRKRDPRYKPNTQTDAERQKMIRDAATAQAARSRAANRAKMAEKNRAPEWAKQSESIEEDVPEILEEEPEENFECVVCRKTFKSENQFDVHEKSRKHLKAVQRLKRDMHYEDKALSLDDGADEPVSITTKGCVRDIAGNAEQKEEEAGTPDQDLVNEQHGDIAASEEATETRRNMVPAGDSSVTPRSSSTISSKDDEYAPRQEVEERILGDDFVERDETNTFNTLHNSTLGIDGLNIAEDIESEKSDSAPSKLGKAKEKRAKKAAQNSAAESTATEVGEGCMNSSLVTIY